MQYPKDLHYTKDHEWISTQGQVGITDYAQDALGDVVFVELPEIGRVVKAGDTVGVIESVKSVSDLYSPAGGKVARVNTKLESEPELINQDPFGEGWVFALEDVALGEVLSAEDYQKHAEGE